MLRISCILNTASHFLSHCFFPLYFFLLDTANSHNAMLCKIIVFTFHIYVIADSLGLRCHVDDNRVWCHNSSTVVFCFDCRLKRISANLSLYIYSIYRKFWLQSFIFWVLDCNLRFLDCVHLLCLFLHLAGICCGEILLKWRGKHPCVMFNS